MDKLNITWSDFHQDVKTLCEKLKQTGEYNKIIAISRGGLIPAGIVAYELDIRHSEVINIVSYDHANQLSSTKIFGYSGLADEHTLVIDDLSDTGNSINLLRQRFPKATYAVVYVKPQGLTAPDIYTKEMPDSWLVFPWDE